MMMIIVNDRAIYLNHQNGIFHQCPNIKYIAHTNIRIQIEPNITDVNKISLSIGLSVVY